METELHTLLERIAVGVERIASLLEIVEDGEEECSCKMCNIYSPGLDNIQVLSEEWFEDKELF